MTPVWSHIANLLARAANQRGTAQEAERQRAITLSVVEESVVAEHQKEVSGTPLSLAEWTAIIIEYKAPLTIAQVCARPDIPQQTRTVAFAALSAMVESMDPVVLDTVNHKQSSLTAALQQQIERSGLLPQLPVLLLQATVSLMMAVGKGHLSGRTARGSHTWSPIIYAQRLLSLYNRVQYVWPPGAFTAEAAAGSAAPATELALAVVGFLGQYAQQQ